MNNEIASLMNMEVKGKGMLDSLGNAARTETAAMIIRFISSLAK